MRRALFFTAYNRVSYLQQTLYSWRSVRGLSDWHIVAMIEPSPVAAQLREEFEFFFIDLGLTDYEIIMNPEVYGVLHHPWVGFERLFAPGDYDFVVRAEDDLIVSDDILEFFTWASAMYRGAHDVATVNGFTPEAGTPEDTERVQAFSPLIWGTWRNRWMDLIGPTWDHDYSTFNVVPGVESGWDWNLNTRLFPSLGLCSIRPSLSRVSNIGVYGTHSTPENYMDTQAFHPYLEPVVFRAADSRVHD